MSTVDVKQIQAAKSYSNALFEMTNELNISQKVFKELEYIISLIKDNNELNEFFTNPVIVKNDKKEVFTTVFGEILSSVTRDFVFLLIDNDRLDILETVVFLFTQKLDRELNIERPSVISAVELNDDFRRRITEQLERKLNSTVIPCFSVEPDIIGGLIIEARDKTIDFSLRTKFKNMTKQLTKG